MPAILSVEPLLTYPLPSTYSLAFIRCYHIFNGDAYLQVAIRSHTFFPVVKLIGQKLSVLVKTASKLKNLRREKIYMFTKYSAHFKKNIILFKAMVDVWRKEKCLICLIYLVLLMGSEEQTWKTIPQDVFHYSQPSYYSSYKHIFLQICYKKGYNIYKQCFRVYKFNFRLISLTWIYMFHQVQRNFMN